MRIDDISLFDFRCYTKLNLSFSPYINIIYGENAVGKTTIVEAINYLSLLKSNIENNDQLVIKDKQNEASINGTFTNDKTSFSSKLLISNKYKKIYKNENQIKKLKEYIGLVNIVTFFPENSLSFYMSPSARRKEINILLCQVSPQYLDNLTRYNRILKERNILLKNEKRLDNNKLTTLLATIDPMIIEAGKNLTFMRAKIIDKINKYAFQYHYKISSNSEKISFFYNPSIHIDTYLEDFNNNIKDDLFHKTTGKGPHRDDFVIEINKKNTCEGCSQGQKRNAIISLKMAEIDIIKEIKQDNPIVLFDDVFSELDQKRQNQIISILNNNVQTFITTTDINQLEPLLIKKAKIIHVQKGSVIND